MKNTDSTMLKYPPKILNMFYYIPQVSKCWYLSKYMKFRYLENWPKIVKIWGIRKNRYWPPADFWWLGLMLLHVFYIFNAYLNLFSQKNPIFRGICMYYYFQALKWPHISKSLSKTLKMLQGAPTVLCFIIFFTKGYYITYFESYDFIMMLDILSRLCLIRNQSA